MYSGYCIGGPHDGELRKSRAKTINVARRRPIGAASARKTIARVVVSPYTLRSINIGQCDSVDYWAPQHMTDLEAILMLFRGYSRDALGD